MSPPRALEEPAIVMVYAIGVACWLLAPEGLRSRFVAMPTADIVLLGAGAAVFAIDHAAPPIGPVAMALFLAGNSVAELGRKVDVGGERDSVRVPRGTQTA
jgi:hypothetical protein